MNVLMVLSLGFDRPGPSLHLLSAVMRGLAARGDRVHVIQKLSGGDGPGIPPDVLDTGLVTTVGIDMPVVGKNNFVGRYAQSLAYVRRAAKAMAGRYDLVYIHSCQTLAPLVRAARRRCPGAKVLVNVQDIFPLNAAAIGVMKKDGLPYRLFAGAQARAYRRADGIITLSRDMQEVLAGEGGRAIEVIPPWTYDDDLRAVPEAENRFLREHPELMGFFRVVYAGNIGQMQNVDIVLEAAGHLREREDICFVIVGGGARAEKLRQKAEDMGLPNVRFYPMQNADRAVEVYSMAHVNLITLAPGVTRTAFPSKTAICCAVARPILAAVDPGSHYASMIRGIPGTRSVPAGDARAFAEAVTDLEAKKRDFCPEARELYARELGMKNGVARHLAFFDQLKGDTT